MAPLKSAGSVPDKGPPSSIGVMSPTRRSDSLFKRRKSVGRILLTILLSAILAWFFLGYRQDTSVNNHDTEPTSNRQPTLPDDEALPQNFYERRENSRWLVGTNATLLRNARIWTGVDDEVIYGDVLIDRGLIKALGKINKELLQELTPDVFDVNRNWVTPGMIDSFWRSYTEQAYETGGATYIMPPHGSKWYSVSYQPGKSGWEALSRSSVAGFTSAVVFQIFEQARLPYPPSNQPGDFIKLRGVPKAAMNPNFAITIEAPIYENARRSNRLRWQYYKHRAESEIAPEFAKWDILPHTSPMTDGYKLFAECITVEDVLDIVRMSQRFELEIAMIDYVGTEYWGEGILRHAWGRTPAIAISNAFTRNGQCHPSDLAVKAFSEQGVRVLVKPPSATPYQLAMKSSGSSNRDVLEETQGAFLCGLMNESYALNSVTSIPADISGYDFRLGRISRGYDADLAVWPMHPLRAGARPLQVWIDGIPQVKRLRPSQMPELVRLPDKLQFNADVQDAPSPL